MYAINSRALPMGASCSGWSMTESDPWERQDKILASGVKYWDKTAGGISDCLAPIQIFLETTYPGVFSPFEGHRKCIQYPT